MPLRWERYPLVSELPSARAWLSFQSKRGLAPNTLEAYGRGLQEFLGFAAGNAIFAEQATRHDIASYIAALRCRPNKRAASVITLNSGARLSNATLQQRITAVRLYYDFLVEEGVRGSNPVGRGWYVPRGAPAGRQPRALLPRLHKLPWIPNERQWEAILEATKLTCLRTRAMFALAYDGALRREEVCAIRIADVDPGLRLLRIRAEDTKNGQERVVPYSASAGELYGAYLNVRCRTSREPGALFLSESRRNAGKPLSIWTWSKAVTSIADQAGVSEFTTHTLRHLSLTDLARDGWDVHEIAKFAGHRSIESTLIYVHLSGRELAAKFEKGMAQIHAWRSAMLGG
jgi:site-specific recombinase XerD